MDDYDSDIADDFDNTVDDYFEDEYDEGDGQEADDEDEAAYACPASNNLYRLEDGSHPKACGLEDDDGNL